MTALWLTIAALAVYALAIATLALAGRRTDARALARLIPDCLVLLRRLLADRRVPRHSKVLIGATIAYLVFPLDLVPDLIPVVGQLDDVIVVALTLRAALRGAGRPVLRELWPGPARSLEVIERVAFARRRPQRGAPRTS